MSVFAAALGNNAFQVDADDPDPRMSFIETDFNKHLVGVYVVKKYLSARILEVGPDFPVPTNALMISEPGKGFEKFISKIGDDQRAIDPREMNTHDAQYSTT